MRGSGHRETICTAGPTLTGEGHEPLQRIVRSGDGDLQGRVDVGRKNRGLRSVDRCGELGHGSLFEPDEDAHTIPVRVGCLHGASAQVD